MTRMDAGAAAAGAGAPGGTAGISGDEQARHEEVRRLMAVYTPAEIVRELDRYIVGQSEAKRAVAVALRNRWRRQLVEDELRDEITPKNIILIGPTGVGKTEIARRLSRLAQAPFLKVEASKFTEVGYVGRDVDSIIRDLTELAYKMVREEESQRMHGRAREQAEERLLDLLVPPRRRVGFEEPAPASAPEVAAESTATREKLRRMLREGKLDERTVEPELSPETPSLPGLQVIGGVMGSGLDELTTNLQDMLKGLAGGRRPGRRKMRVPEALEALTAEEAQALVDAEDVRVKAVRRVEQSGIVFLDELDKIAGRDRGHGPDVSREGVQRDLLPLVEGTTVMTKHGMVRTEHILFIAAGAFHVSKPSDLVPELQGRFPIRVELRPLGREDLYRILTEPENSLLRQYRALLATEGVDLLVDDEAVREVSDIAATVNGRGQDIGARRLHTVLERLLEEVSFTAPDLAGREVRITRDYVRERLAEIVEDEDLSRYIL